MVGLICLSVTERGTSRSPTRIVGPSFSPFSPISFCFADFVALLSDVYALRVPGSAGGLTCLLLHNVPLSPAIFFALKSVSSDGM